MNFTVLVEYISIEATVRIDDAWLRANPDIEEDLQFQNAADAGATEPDHPFLKGVDGRIGQRLLGAHAAAAPYARRLIAVSGIARQTLLADLHEHGAQVAHLVGAGSGANTLRRSLLSKCLQVLAADLARGLDTVTQFTHGSGEDVERRIARLPGEVGAAQLVADPLERGMRPLQTLVSHARRWGYALQRQGVAPVDAVRHFLGFAEDSEARVRGECVGADCFVGRVPRRSGWPQRMRLPPRVLVQARWRRASVPER